MEKKQAIVLAAGLGTRLRPLTLTMPKALVPYKGKPMLYHVLERLDEHGFRSVVINIHHFGEQILAYLEEHRNFGMNISISDEREMLLDTGGALKKAAHLFSPGPVLAHNTDIDTNLDLNRLWNYHLAQRSYVTLAVKERETTRSLLMGKDGLLSGWRDNRTGEEILCRQDIHSAPVGFSGIYVVSREFLDRLPRQEAFALIPVLLEQGGSMPVRLMLHNDSYWKDMGKASD